MAHSLRSLAVAVAALSTLLPAQSPDPEEGSEAVLAESPVDPFTKNEAKAMQALGIVGYGPIEWADGLRSGDLEKVLGEKRILWLETAHFRIGCTLGSAAMPPDPDARKLVNAELKRLSKKWSKLPSRASKLSTWLRLHLYAQRCEELYADFASLVAHDDGSGTFLGQRGKFVVLLFQKKSDLVRYLDRFCGRQSQLSQCIHHAATGQHGVALTAEGDEVRPEAAVYAHLRLLLVQAFTDALGGAPYWLQYGLGHWYERQVPTDTIFCAPKENEHVDPMTQHEWHDKVAARIERDSLVVPFRTLCTSTDLGYFEHLQSWSRVDYLMDLDREKVGQFLIGAKGGFGAERQAQLLEQLFGMEPEAFDAKWRAWVRKTYK